MFILGVSVRSCDVRKVRKAPPERPEARWTFRAGYWLPDFMVVSIHLMYYLTLFISKVFIHWVRQDYESTSEIQLPFATGITGLHR